MDKHTLNIISGRPSVCHRTRMPDAVFLHIGSTPKPRDPSKLIHVDNSSHRYNNKSLISVIDSSDPRFESSSAGCSMASSESLHGNQCALDQGLLSEKDTVITCAGVSG